MVEQPGRSPQGIAPGKRRPPTAGALPVTTDAPKPLAPAGAAERVKELA